MSQASPHISGYRYENAAYSHAHSYLLPAVLRIMRGMNWPAGNRRIFELGSGNGATAALLERFLPRAFARRVFDLLEDNGTAIISTPFHGYWKNLALALTGKLDKHFTVLWDYGHIKFWSERTLRELLEEAGFTDIRFERVGRIRPLAKSMIAIARRPGRA